MGTWPFHSSICIFLLPTKVLLLHSCSSRDLDTDQILDPRYLLDKHFFLGGFNFKQRFSVGQRMIWYFIKMLGVSQPLLFTSL